MLILRRKVGESFLVGDQIRVTILDMEANGTVNIGIDAPKNVLILRSELRQATSANQDAAQSPSTQAVEALFSALSLGQSPAASPQSRTIGLDPIGKEMFSMDMMSGIAATATSLSAAQTLQSYSLAVSKKAMDTQEMAAQAMLEMLGQQPVPAKGTYIDTYA